MTDYKNINPEHKARISVLSEDREMDGKIAESAWRSYCHVLALMTAQDKSHVIAVDCMRTIQIYIDMLSDEAMKDGTNVEAVKTIICEAWTGATGRTASDHGNLSTYIQDIAFDYPDFAPVIVERINELINGEATDE